MSRPHRQKNPGEADGGDLLAVARLHRPHGLGGEVRAEPLTPEILDFEELLAGREIALRHPGRPLLRVRVRFLRPYQTGFLIGLEGFDDRTSAESLNGAELCLAREELPVLPEGWYWEADLIGAEVRDVTYGVIGQAAGLEEFAGRWALRVSRPGAEDVLIPWSKGLLERVDLPAGTIIFKLPLDFPGIS